MKCLQIVANQLAIWIGVAFSSVTIAADDESAIERGHRAFARSDFEKALRFYAEVSPEEEAVSLFYRGCILLETRKWTEATTCFEDALKLEPDDGALKFLIALTEVARENPGDSIFELAVALKFEQPDFAPTLDEESELQKSFMSFATIFEMKTHPTMVDQDLLEGAAADASGPLERLAVLTLRSGNKYDKLPKLQALLDEFPTSAALRAEFVNQWQFKEKEALQKLDEWIQLEPENGYPQFVRFLYRLGPVANSEFISFEAKIPIGPLAASEIERLAEFKVWKTYDRERREAVSNLRKKLGVAFASAIPRTPPLGQFKEVNRCVAYRIERDINLNKVEDAAELYSSWQTLTNQFFADGSYVSESLRIGLLVSCEKPWLDYQKHSPLPAGVQLLNSRERMDKIRQTLPFGVHELMGLPVPSLFNETCDFISEDEVSKTEALMERFGIESN